MRPDLGAVRQRYLGTLAAAFAVVPLCGYALILWLGFATPSSLFDAWPGRLLTIFTALWWLGALLYFRGVLEAAVQAARRADATRSARAVLRRLHGHYWLWLGVYTLFAAIFYAAARVTPVEPPLFNWVQCLLLQLLAAILVGMPFYLRLLAALAGLLAAVGVDRTALSVETKLLLMAVLAPLTAGAALMYFQWWHDASWSLEDLLVWCALGLLLSVTGLLGVRHLQGALQPLQKLIATPAPRPADLTALRPASADEFGLLIEGLVRVGDTLGHEGIRARTLIEAVADSMVITDAEGRIVMLNSAAERLLDCPASRARGMAIASLLPALGNGGIGTAPEQPQEMEAHRPAGDSLPVRVRVSRLGAEEPVRYLCWIKERSQAEDWSGARPDEPYRQLVQSARDVIWRADRNGRWTFVNEAARHLYGVEAADIVGRDVHSFTEPAHLARERAAFQALWEGRDWLELESVHHDRSGALHHLSIIAHAHKDAHGAVTGLTGISRDVTAHKMHEQMLSYQASHDALTGLFNRQYLRQELERMVARAARGSPGGALLFIDLDQLKYINDKLGHGTGDRLLTETAGLMKRHTREGDLLARYGGDEFVVLLYNSNEEGARIVAENLRSRFGEYKFLMGGNAYSVTCSIGIALLDESARSADESLQRAERACHAAKSLGRDRVVLQARVVPADAERPDASMERIKQLIEEERVQLLYQPIATMASGSVFDYEVLLRLVEPAGQVLTPGAFLPTAERLGLSRRLDRAVVAKAAASLAALRAAGHPVRLFVKLTAHALRDETLLPRIRETLAESRLDGALFTFEITESAAVADVTASAAFIAAVKQTGARVVLEHFGQGFGSFTYLRRLPVDALKIDGSFVRGLGSSIVNQAVVRAINQVAHALGKSTIAPLVESRETLILLRDMGVDYAQGYVVGRPEETVGAERYISTDVH